MSDHTNKKESTHTPPGAVTDDEGRVLADASDKRTHPVGQHESDSPESVKARAEAAESKTKRESGTDKEHPHKHEQNHEHNH